MPRKATGAPLGRPPLDPDRTFDPPTTMELQPTSNYIWVEGKILVEGYDSERRADVDRLHQIAKKLGLVVHEADITKMGQFDRVYRRWSGQRIPLEFASDILRDNSEGLTVPELAKAIYHEPDWTEQHLQAAVKKTYVVIQKLKSKGWATKTEKGKIISTLAKHRNPVSPVLVDTVKNILNETGDVWPEQAIRRFIRLVGERFMKLPLD